MKTLCFIKVNFAQGLHYSFPDRMAKLPSLKRLQVTIIKLSLVAADSTALSRNHSVDCVAQFFSGLLELNSHTKKGSSSESRGPFMLWVMPTILWLNLSGWRSGGEKTGNYHPTKVNTAIHPSSHSGEEAQGPSHPEAYSPCSASPAPKAGFQGEVDLR